MRHVILILWLINMTRHVRIKDESGKRMLSYGLNFSTQNRDNANVCAQYESACRINLRSAFIILLYPCCLL